MSNENSREMSSLPEEKFITPIQIRLSDIDFFGHVHAARMMEMVFTARKTEVDNRFSTAGEMLKKENLGWVIAGVEIRYLRQVLLEDAVEVHTWTRELREKECDVGFIVFKNGGKRAAEGTLHFTLVKWPSGRSVVLPDAIREQYVAGGMIGTDCN